MSIAFIVITALVIIVSVLLVALILAQKKDAAGFTNGMGGMVSSNTYWGQNKKNSIEGKLEFLTKIAVVVYFVLVLVSNFVNFYCEREDNFLSFFYTFVNPKVNLLLVVLIIV